MTTETEKKQNVTEAQAGTPIPPEQQHAEIDRAKQLMQEMQAQKTVPAQSDVSVQGQTSVQQTLSPARHVDTSAMERDLRAINDAAAAQQTARIDEATRVSADQLRQQERDAQAQYSEQQKQIAADERQALDNAALYAEARGDRGGVGQAQYNAIQAQAMKNRAAVQQAQTKLAGDVTRQIGDLRRQGEYQKADALLSLSQQYLSQINQLRQWAAEMNMSADQVNNAIAQWQMEFAQAEADLTGVYKGQKTMAAQQYDDQLARQKAQDALNLALTEADITGMYKGQKTMAAQQYEDQLARQKAQEDYDRWLDAQSLALERDQIAYNRDQDALDRALTSTQNTAKQGWTALDSGMIPNASQLAAMGITAEQAKQYLALQAATSEQTGQKTDDYDGLFAAAAKAQSPENYIASHYKEYGFNSATGLVDAFTTYQKKTTTQQDNPANVSIGVIDPATNRMITRADPRVLNVTYDSQGRAVYHLKDGRTLTDSLGGKETSRIPGKTVATYLK